ncbi:membrane protein FAM174B [Ctenodactylus gundi]
MRAPPPRRPSLLLLLGLLLASPAAGARISEASAASPPHPGRPPPPPASRTPGLGPGNATWPDSGQAGSNSSGDALISRISTLLRDLPTLKAAAIVACAFSALLAACLLLRVFRSGKRLKKTRKYDIITTPAERVEMAPLNEEDDDDEDSTVFDVKYSSSNYRAERPPHRRSRPRGLREAGLWRLWGLLCGTAGGWTLVAVAALWLETPRGDCCCFGKTHWPHLDGDGVQAL